MDTMEEKAEWIGMTGKALVEYVRNYSRVQKKIWQQIAYLALEADGRTGRNDRLKKAYELGLWMLESTFNEGYHTVAVDLATGDLVNVYSALKLFSAPEDDTGKDHDTISASDHDVIRIALNIQELDAEKIVDGLKRKISAPYADWYDAQEQEAWKEKKKQELGLAKVYVRG